MDVEKDSRKSTGIAEGEKWKILRRCCHWVSAGIEWAASRQTKKAGID
jgi:hypothetical protein